jgi:hypothetical protein
MKGAEKPASGTPAVPVAAVGACPESGRRDRRPFTSAERHSVAIFLTH